MSDSFKPNGYPSLSPYLVVYNVPKMLTLLNGLFNAKILRRYDMEDGSIMHAELQLDDSVLMIGEASEAFPPIRQLLHVYVPDVDRVYDQAIQLGCTELEKPNKRDGDPDRRGSFKDFSGNVWSVSTQLS